MYDIACLQLKLQLSYHQRKTYGSRSSSSLGSGCSSGSYVLVVVVVGGDSEATPLHFAVATGKEQFAMGCSCKYSRM